MNMRQRWILLSGLCAAMLALMFGASRPRPTIVGPVLEHASGEFSQAVTDAILPTWVLYTELGLLVLTGVALYRARSMKGTR